MVILKISMSSFLFSTSKTCFLHSLLDKVLKEIYYSLLLEDKEQAILYIAPLIKNSHSMKRQEEKNQPSLSQKLSTLIKEANIEVTALSRYTGVPIATINRIKNDPYSNPTISTLIPLAKFFSISIDDLVLSNTNDINKIKNNKHLIPIIDIKDINKISPPHILTERNSVEVTSKIPINCFAIRIKEKNSLSITKNFCYYITEPQEKVNDRDIIVAIVNNREPDIFRLIIDDGDFYLKPILDSRNTQMINSKKFKVIGIVRQIIFE